MNKLEKQFAAFLAEKLQPVSEREIVRPTRVVWRAQAGQVRTQVFPTEARAIEFASTKPGSEIMDVSEPVPAQPAGITNGFRRHVVYCESRQYARFREKRSA